MIPCAENHVLGISPASCSGLINFIFARTPKTTFSRFERSPATHFWSLLECTAPGRSSQCGDPRFSRAYRQPSTHFWSLLECTAPGSSSQCGTRGFLGLTANPLTKNLRDCTHDLKEKKQRFENSTQLQQERAHARLRTTSTHSPGHSASYTLDVLLRASSSAHTSTKPLTYLSLRSF